MTKAGLFAEFQTAGFPDILFHKLRNLGARGTEEKFGVQQVEYLCGPFRPINVFHLGEVLKSQGKATAKLTGF